MISTGDKKLFLIDAYALIYRAYFAFSKNPRITSNGFETSAIYGFTNILFDLIKTESPTYLGVVFDTPKKTHRHIEYVEYKANRDAMPEGISAAIPYIKKILNSFNIPILSLEGYEADDVIGTLARQADKKMLTTYMMTPDKDFAQLVTDNIFMYRPGNRGNPSEIWDTKKVCEKFNIDNVSQVVDFLGMVGDSVDNIPGIPGVGPKTASKLIKMYGSVEGVYNATDQLEGKIKEKIINAKEQALLSKKLAKIVVDAPIVLDLKSLKFQGPDLGSFKALCEELEFRRIYDRVSSKFNSKNDLPKTTNSDGQLNMFELGQDITSDILNRGTLINNIERFKDFISSISAKSELGFVFLYKQESIIGLSISQSIDVSHYVIFNKSVQLDQCLLLLSPVFSSATIEKVFFDAKKFFKTLLERSVFCGNNFFDISIADYLINPDSNRTFSAIIQKNNIDTINIDLLDLNLSKDISASLVEQSLLLFKLKSKQVALLEKNKLNRLFYDVELPLVSVLLDMEKHGVNLDVESLEKYSQSLTHEMTHLENRIYDAADEKFNIASPKQLGDILFNKMKLSEKPKKTKSGQFSTNESELVKLKGRHPIIDDILLFRTYQKLLSTYINALPLLVDSRDQKIHTTFNQTVTNTGRLSSSKPNLQNIPIRKQSGKDVRRAFIPSRGDYVLMAADYSQIELRLIAELSQEDNMMEAFLNNEDIHASTASKVFKVDINDVTSEMRANAKTVNFGIIYGVSAFGLSEQSTLNRKEASELIKVYFETYPRLKSYMDDQVNFARENGYVETILGRKRYLRNINSRNSFIRGHDERNAVNMPVQGSAADIIKLAMIQVNKKMKELDLSSKMVLQVHDELVFDVLISEREKMSSLVKDIMENVYSTKIPLKVDIGFGANWLEAH